MIISLKEAMDLVKSSDLQCPLSKGIEPIKVMSMGGWKDLKTMQIYVRKAGINIRGITDGLELEKATSVQRNIFT